MIGSDAFQETDVFGMTLSLTKWSRLVRTIDEIPDVIAEGFHWARSGRPGPVVIDIPTDVLKARRNSPDRRSSLRMRVPPTATPRVPSAIRSSLCCSGRPGRWLGGRGSKAVGSDSGTAATARSFEYSHFGDGARTGGDPAAVALLPGHGGHARHARGQPRLHETDLLMVFGRAAGRPRDRRSHALCSLTQRSFTLKSTRRSWIGCAPVNCRSLEISRIRFPHFTGVAPRVFARLELIGGPWRAVRSARRLMRTGLAQPTIRFLDELFSRLPEG
jgi:hypothetical protein